ncbi:MAG: protein MraZ protein [candidate division Kazan bacterium GW2011_GWA1_50_15]|uniref:Transcriptional regulator MraZ n=2 Tax=Bacteria division Kazan-3B-28 TaxID=1798534 RepID=A0A0G2A3U2_UNCK3|nr:MAG: protein MraZ protein [candidate division Kazan bacterium GW2011_GWA1_50_15]KKW25574.1 MAG: Protein MraZ [candidate division Kazan bacterium GW2011_GWC1_52_13]KKW26879.1 MAG: Protein MraZ [candidate division Kazan bacterium GW2011_GWB1_52_7]HAV65874.1 division/cell wall cluster transcriptional repressor MraZ [Patescibacteria group bacterium]HCR42717.1 division/cell wall cluster transcriptional repressor MraZ [Patescibacteria group bacterium]
MDNVFIGEYTHVLDSKGRLAIPVKFKNLLERGAVVTKGLDGCLFLYTEAEWAKLVARLNQMPISQSNSRAFARLMLAGAMPVSLDSQNRINLPNYLIAFAGLGGTAVLAGLMNRLEIWDTKKWASYKKKTEPESEKIAEQLFI